MDTQWSLSDNLPADRTVIGRDRVCRHAHRTRFDPDIATIAVRQMRKENL